jgi:hypothetical protein
LPGQNPFINEHAASNHLPLEATLGGAETMYPEFAVKLKTLPSAQKPAAPASAPKTPEKSKR